MGHREREREREQKKIMNKDISNDLTLSQTIPCFYKSFENSLGNGEIPRNEQFLLFPQRFLPLLSTVFIKFGIVFSKLFQS